MSYLVTANLNLDSRFRPYRAGDRVAAAAYLDIEAGSPREAAEQAFAIGNGHGLDAAGAGWPAGARSLSVGDVLYLAEGDESETRGVTILAVEACGWAEVALPADGCQAPAPR